MVRRQGILLGAVVVLLVALVYGRSLGYSFLTWDDDQNITANRLLLQGPWWRFWTAPHRGLYIPPVYTLWSLLAWMQTPLNPMLFHGLNLALHLANTALVMIVAERFLQARGAWTGAAVAGLLFALHPLQVESVAWVTGARDLLCTFWLLLATWLYLRADDRVIPQVWAWLAFALALLSKPSAVALPAALLLLDGIMRQRPWRASLARLLPWFILVPPVILITKAVQAEGIDQALQQLVWWQRLVVAADTIGFYLSKVLWPWPLAIDYGHTPQAVLAGERLALDLSVLAGLALLAWIFRRVLQRTGTAWLLWAVVLMLPTSGLVAFSYQHTSTVADHYAYAPMAGLAIAAAWLLGGLPMRHRLVLASVLVALLATASSQRLPVWSSDDTVYPSMVATRPRSFAGLIGLTATALRAKRYEEALAYVTKAQEIEPMNIAALANRGLALARLERYDELLAELGSKMPDRKLILAYPLSAPDMATLLMTIAFAQIRKGDVVGSLPTLCRARFADAANQDVVTFMPLIAGHLGRKVEDRELCEEDYRR